MKKLISSFLSALLLITSVTCLAADDTSSAFNAETNDTLAEAEQYAYLDLDTATSALQEKILDARNTIIFSKDWVADGYEAYVEDVTTGEILEVLPSFSELFPDWDLPADDTVLPSLSEANLSETSFPVTSVDLTSSSAWLRLASKNYYLPAASNSQDASPFITFTVDSFEMGTSIRSYATSLTSSETCNIGYKNASTGESLGFKKILSEKSTTSHFVQKIVSRDLFGHGRQFLR